ncbi:GntR family transcriptional regulator [Roseibium aquae]|uniref:GntR family transcriptional regulator n=1 Tax=Roseibium aquae TaxID=1323746 RepID=A0A916WV85_9HYPH|nr:GntR family transcriptional regulator [Roseibium aquae]GGB33401.1 GntR family transcriptional regulator [Roseibium aquae]
MTQTAKITRVGDAYDRLKADILSSALPAGYQAPEPDIAVRLGMSRTPVREALIRLEAEGLVSLVPRRGALVVGITASDLEEIYELLSVFESAVAAGVARKGLTPGSHEELTLLAQQLDNLGAEADVDGWVQSDRSFHCRLAEFYGNMRLLRQMSGLFDQVHRARLILHGLAPAELGPRGVHASILAAISARDADQAQRLAREHRLDTLAALKAQFLGSRLPAL